MPPHRFGGWAALGTGIPFDKPLSLRIAGHYNAATRLQLGCGTGRTCYEKTQIPLFCGIRVLLTRPGQFTP